MALKWLPLIRLMIDCDGKIVSNREAYSQIPIKLLRLQTLSILRQEHAYHYHNCFSIPSQLSSPLFDPF